MDPKIDLKTILDLHIKWMRNEPGGARADLSGADLSGANISGANLSRANISRANISRANLSRANLSWADLSGADIARANISRANISRANLSGANIYRSNLSGADLSGADLSGANIARANLSWANLSWADLPGADLSGANLSGADLSGANLSRADISGANLKNCKQSGLALAMTSHLPEGPFHAWKKCCNEVIVKLLIPEDAERSHGSERKCRASKAVVLEVIGADEGVSIHDRTTRYRVGETVTPDGWDTDRWNTCGHGIHFFITRIEAEAYQ